VPEFERDPNEIGCLWEKHGANGDYFSGVINGQKIVAFRNDRKKYGSNAPDWRILKARSREETPF
jgi:hypothetical protein